MHPVPKRYHKFYFPVRGPLQRSATPGIDMVRGPARIQAEKHGAPGPGNRPNWDTVPVFLHSLHYRPPFGHRTDHEEAIHQVHLPFCVVFHVSV